MAVEHSTGVSRRETIAWTLVGIAVAAFLAFDVLLTSTIVNKLMGLSDRTRELECQQQVERAINEYQSSGRSSIGSDGVRMQHDSSD